eukprot:528405_1
MFLSSRNKHITGRASGRFNDTQKKILYSILSSNDTQSLCIFKWRITGIKHSIWLYYSIILRKQEHVVFYLIRPFQQYAKLIYIHLSYTYYLRIKHCILSNIFHVFHVFSW